MSESVSWYSTTDVRLATGHGCSSPTDRFGFCFNSECFIATGLAVRLVAKCWVGRGVVSHRLRQIKYIDHVLDDNQLINFTVNQIV